MPALPVVRLLQLLLAGLSIASAGRNLIPEECNQYQPLYESIDRDLALYKRSGGITPHLFYKMMVLHTAGYREKGLAVAFYNGKAYVISNTKKMDLRRFGHHVGLWVAYLRMMLHLQGKYGSALPNVEFVWHTIDRPVFLTVEPNSSRTNTSSITGGSSSRGGYDNYPVFRFCKSAAHPDILVPNFHFYMKRYQAEYLDRIPQINKRYRWAERQQTLLARFTAYGRYVHPNDSNTQRLDAAGQPLCKYQATNTAICPARAYLVEWAAKYSDLLDISSHPQMPMADHAKYRYLLHVDGQGLSSKLEILLTLGSLVMKEESGYMAFYHHLLEPGVHFLPVWKAGSGPQDMLEAVRWARANDEAAHKIALAGQAFAAMYLSAQARECYWLRLLQSYSETMTYDPMAFRNISELSGGVGIEGRWRLIQPVQQFIDETVASFFPDVVRESVWEP